MRACHPSTITTPIAVRIEASAWMRRVGHVLRDKREKGIVRSLEETGLWLQWEIVR